MTQLFTGRHQNLTRKSVEIGLANKWSTRDVESENEANGAPIASENEGDPVLQEQREVEMPVEASVESACVKRGSDAVADTQERARLRLRAEGKRGQKHEKQDVLEPQAKTRARLESRRGWRAKAPNLFQIWRKRSRRSTVLVESGPAPIQGGSSSIPDVPVDSSVATKVIVEDMVQTSVLNSTSVGIQPASSGTVGSLCFNESKARDFDKLTNLALTSDAFPGRPSRESVQGLVKTCLEMCAVDLTEV